MRKRSATRDPKARASSTQSDMVAPASGTNGTTSTAPMRGCSPELLLHVDLGDGDGHGPLQGLEDRGRLAGQRQDAAVVAGVAGAIEQEGARNALHGRDQLVDDLHPAALAEVRDRLDKLGHATSVSSRPPSRGLPMRATRREVPVTGSNGHYPSAQPILSWHRSNATGRVMPREGAVDSMPRDEGTGMTGAPRPSLWRHRDFLKIWSAATVSVVGSQVTIIALPFIALTMLGASVFQVSLLAAVEMLPFLLFTLPAGAWLDRIRRRPVLIAADFGRGVVLLSIPAAYMAGALDAGTALCRRVPDGHADRFLRRRRPVVPARPPRSRGPGRRQRPSPDQLLGGADRRPDPRRQPDRDGGRAVRHRRRRAELLHLGGLHQCHPPPRGGAAAQAGRVRPARVDAVGDRGRPALRPGQSLPATDRRLHRDVQPVRRRALRRLPGPDLGRAEAAAGLLRHGHGPGQRRLPGGRRPVEPASGRDRHRPDYRRLGGVRGAFVPAPDPDARQPGPRGRDPVRRAGSWSE